MSSGKKQVLPRQRLQELLSLIDNSQTLDVDVEEALVGIANDFVERVVTASCQLAKHRGSSTLEVKDVKLHLERNWNIRVPGYHAEEVKQVRDIRGSDAQHKQRMALVQKELANPAKRRPKGPELTRAQKRDLVREQQARQRAEAAAAEAAATGEKDAEENGGEAAEAAEAAPQDTGNSLFLPDES
eukprot:m.234234 g.234234  ORF g.234234 m.234234 type:complete len:186 (-) comp22470_c1_seq2:39-596(-)